MSELSLTLPALRPARVARLFSMMQKERAVGPRGPHPLPLAGEEETREFSKPGHG